MLEGGGHYLFGSVEYTVKPLALPPRGDPPPGAPLGASAGGQPELALRVDSVAIGEVPGPKPNSSRAGGKPLAPEVYSDRL